ncbi:hypothetical protein DPMN_081683 [Dreissena polymorpha]|uniref:Uncharacterized protein n=1 Tax=Dreissena polymorpha TaxID=45954 RepID=A0A9D3Y5H4_DREPO|nr:hypothetical protein DPMN_081683 [Dreissena polymorpha]
MNSEHLGGNVFQQTVYVFVYIHNIIKTNILIKFHEDWTRNVTYRPYIWKNAPPPLPGGPDIIRTILVTKCHEDQIINVAARVLTKNAPPTGAHVFQPTGTIFQLI